MKLNKLYGKTLVLSYVLKRSSKQRSLCICHKKIQERPSFKCLLMLWYNLPQTAVSMTEIKHYLSSIYSYLQRSDFDYEIWEQARPKLKALTIRDPSETDLRSHFEESVHFVWKPPSQRY